jgi:hypothetical protein
MIEVYRTAEPLRRRLADPDCPMDFAVLVEFREQGITDYLGCEPIKSARLAAAELPSTLS